MATITYPAKDVLYGILHSRVNEYFTKTGTKKTGTRELFTKTVILFTVFVGIYITTVFYKPTLIGCAFLGILIAAMGFSIMHDASHGSYHHKKWVNEFVGLIMLLMGASMRLWKIKHVMIHHALTDTEHDDDLNAYPLMRMHPSQKVLWHHQFQHIYAPLAYALLYLAWIWGNDFKKYFSGMIHTTKISKFSRKDHIEFWASKICHFGIMLYTPYLQLGFWPTVVGYLIFAGVLGIIMSLVFQLAHVVETSHFPTSVNNQIIEGSWAKIQLQETADFSTDNKILSWIVGGLNFQVEHHLFPKISHVHYPTIRRIVKIVCQEQGIIHNEFPTTIGAVASHFRMLKKFGQEA